MKDSTQFARWRSKRSIRTNILIDAVLVIKDLIALLLIGTGLMLFFFAVAVVLFTVL